MKTIQEMVQKATGATGTLLTCSLVCIKEIEAFAELVREDERNRTWTQEHWTEYEHSIAAAEREAIAQSLDKQADLACDEIDRQWAQEMAAAIRARGQE